MAQHSTVDARAANNRHRVGGTRSHARPQMPHDLLLQGDLDYLFLRLSMVIVFAFFGYTKWHLYAVPILTPIVQDSPVLWPIYNEFGIRATLRFLGASEWTIFVLLFSGFWDARLGLLGAIGSTVTFFTTVMIIPFTPRGWAESAGGFPAMAGDVPFLMKDLVLLAASIYLLKRDALRLRDAQLGAGPLNLVSKVALSVLAKVRFFDYDVEYYLLRASLIIVFFFFGYEKWFSYATHDLIPFVTSGPFISWLLPLFDIQTVSWFLGFIEWSIGLLLLFGLWSKKLGVIGAMGSACAAATGLSIIPFMPGGWDAAAGGFPAMTGNTPFLLKDIVLLAASVYLIKQDVLKASADRNL
jgi:uncharacterized membrane protein YkgB